MARPRPRGVRTAVAADEISRDGTSLPARLRARLGARPDLLPEGSTVLVALSGGPDSTALLHLLLDLAPERRLRIVAAHFDHGVRPGSAGEAARVAAAAEEAGVPCAVGRPEAPLEHTQAAFRTARYRFLHRVARRTGADRIATGHQADDQAETVLLRILRGSGLRGLRGIPARRGPIVRPLLPFGREEVTAFLEARGIPWLDDPSNRDPRWTRARIRHELLPALERLAGAPMRPRLAAVARRARRLDRALEAAAAAAIQGPLETLWEEGPGEDGPVRARVDLGRLRAYDRHVRARIVRRLARRVAPGGARPRGTLAAVEFIRRGRSGGGIDLAEGLRAWREFDHLWVGSPPERGSDEPLEIPGPGPGLARARVGGRTYRVAWGREPGGAGTRWVTTLPLTALRFPLRVRGPRPGDRLRLPRGDRKLKRLFNEHRVPLSERARVPVLAAGDEVLWVAGIGRAEPPDSPGDEERLFIGIGDA